MAHDPHDPPCLPSSEGKAPEFVTDKAPAAPVPPVDSARPTPSVPQDPWVTTPPTSQIADEWQTDRGGSASTAVSTFSLVVPGYAILDLLGKGGMGVVYKARHLKLDRVVALKMIRNASDADADLLARFRTEAETIARLQNPHIVQIHEIGEHEGNPYITLEFCAGGGLDRRLRESPLSPPEAARLVETVARAMDAVHQCHVIHRDLKPANILLAADGSPKITDFGLAKKLDAVDRTMPGRPMGTPSYMAPEQALGKVKEIGPAADVYALGAILYEALTGRPPFRAASLRETLNQVVSNDPVPPRRLQPSTPRDLETICLKCLQKDPAKRYTSAAALADDLGRFVRGEPIHARPVGRVEVLAKWARRNPAAAAFLTLLLVAAIASSVAAFHFRDLSDKERIARENTETANKNLIASYYELEGTTARSWLLPLATQPGPLSDTPLSDQEAEVLPEIAANRNEHVTIRFVEEALKEARFTRRLGVRSDYALHAALGLDSDRRKEVERLLTRGLEAPGFDDETRTDLALIASELGELSPDSAAVVGKTLIRALGKSTNSVALRRLAKRLAPVAARMESKEAAAAAALLTQAMTKTTNPNAFGELGGGMAAVVARMEPKEGARAAAASAALFTQAMTKATDPTALQQLATGLAAVAARMEPKAAATSAAEAATLLTLAMTKTNDRIALLTLAQGLEAVAPSMEPKEAGEAATVLTRGMSKTTDDRALWKLATGLAAVAARMEPKEAAEAAAEAAALLTQAMTTKSGTDLWGVAEGLAAVVARMEPKEAAVLLTRAMTENKNQLILTPLEKGLAAAAARLEPKDAAEVANLLTRSMTDATDNRTLEALAHGLAAVRLEPKEAARAAAEAAALLTQAMTRSTDASALSTLARGLAAVAGRLEPKEAAKAAAPLTQAMTKTTDPYTQGALAQGLAAAAARLEPKEAARAAAEAAALLTQAMTKTTNLDALESLTQGLAAVAAGMKPQEAARVLASTSFARILKDNALHTLFLARALASCYTELLGRLEKPDLVELLKQPFWVGVPRRLVLDELGKRYQRHFADQWDFVHFAEEQKLGFDLAGPPKIRQTTELKFP